MRWVVRLGIPLLLIFAAYTLWPFVDLYRLVHAVEHHDLSTIQKRVEFRTVATSLNRQVLHAYLRLTGKEARLGPFGQMLIGTTATALTDQAIDKMAAPDRLVDILSGQWPGDDAPRSRLRLLPQDLRDAWNLYAGSEYSFDDFYVTVPPSAEQRAAFRIRLRLIRWTWKLHDIQLPDELRLRLARQLMAASEAK